MAVQDIINDASDRADAAVEQAKEFIDQLAVLAADESINLGGSLILPWDTSLYDLTSVDEFEEVTVSSPEGIVNPNLDAPVEPNVPNDVGYFTDSVPEVWDIETIPEFNDEPFELDVPERPSVNVIEPAAPKELGDFNLGDWDTYNIPDTPGIRNINVPEIDLPAIDAINLSVPELTFQAPNESFAFVEQEYSSDLLNSLQNLIKSDIMDGGYGINPDDEQQIYSRARERESIQAAAAINKVRKGIAARGFPVPPGSLYAAEQVILKDGQTALSQLNREIVLNRSKLYVEARQFAVQQGLNLEQALINYAGAKQERALKSSQMVAEFAIKFHNARVDLFKLEITIKQLYRDLYNEQLQYAQVKIQEYEKKLAYVDSTNKQDQLAMQDYQKKLDKIKLLYDAQKARDEHTRLQLEYAKLKLQDNQVQVDLYATKIRAKSEELNLYKSAWQGEEIKQSLFKQKLDAYDQRVMTIDKKAQINRDKFKAELERINVNRERTSMILQNYESVLKGRTADLGAKVDTDRQRIDIWKNKQAQMLSNSENDLKQKIAQAASMLNTQEANIRLLNDRTNAFLSLKGLNSKAAEAALTLLGNAVKGASEALSAITVKTE